MEGVVSAKIRHCRDCGVEAPESDTNYTLISGSGWRVEAATDEIGRRVALLRCPACSKRHRDAMRPAGRSSDSSHSPAAPTGRWERSEGAPSATVSKSPPPRDLPHPPPPPPPRVDASRQAPSVSMPAGARPPPPPSRPITASPHVDTGGARPLPSTAPPPGKFARPSTPTVRSVPPPPKPAPFAAWPQSPPTNDEGRGGARPPTTPPSGSRFRREP